MEHHEAGRVRNAASQATRVLPPAIAEMVSRELTALADFGYRINKGALLERVIDELFHMPMRQPGAHP
jgi:hypothetical protein